MTDLQSLLSRVEKANGPDRELDARLSALDPKWIGYKVIHYDSAEEWVLVWPERETRPRMFLPEYSTSLDAALALVERMGLDPWRILYEAMMHWKAHVPGKPLALLPLCVIAALLRALIAQEERGQPTSVEGET